MSKKTLLASAFALALIVPAFAEDKPAAITPAAVEQIQLVDTLARYGVARQDPIMLIAAARLAKSMSADAPAPSAKIPSVDEMLDSAKGFAAGDGYVLSLIDDVRAAQSKAYCYGPYGTGWC
jgi:hypothetical protein